MGNPREMSMPKFDFAKAKDDIAQIVEIVKTVPEPLQQRCFELLFEVAFSDQAPVVREPTKETPATPNEAKGDQERPSPQGKKLQPNILAFMHRNNVSSEDLSKLFMLDHDPLLPVYRLPKGKIAKAQLFKVMMVLLENGLLNNALSAPYTELRQSVKDDGLYDSNFTKLFKTNSDLFRGEVDEDGVVELTGPGMIKLAEIVKELGQ
jgi:hypothetical protein